MLCTSGPEKDRLWSYSLLVRDWRAGFRYPQWPETVVVEVHWWSLRLRCRGVGLPIAVGLYRLLLSSGPHLSTPMNHGVCRLHAYLPLLSR